MSAAEVPVDPGPTAPVAAAGRYVIGGLIVTADTVASLVIDGVLEPEELEWRDRDLVVQLAEIGRRRADAAVNLVAASCRHRGGYAHDGHASIRGWGKALCNWSNHQARVSTSIIDLIEHHPLVRTEYLAGRIGLAQMVELARLANHPRAGDQFTDSEALLVDDAQQLCYDDFRIVCGRWLMLADPDGADQDEKLKHHLRSACCITDIDGMVHLDARFAGVQGATIKAIFDRFVNAETEADFDTVRSERQAAGDDTPVAKADLPRLDEQRRADALSAIFTRAASTPPDAKPPVPVVNVLIDHDTLEKLVNEEPIDPATYRARRCETADGNPIAPADVIAALLIGQVRRIVVDGISTIIDKGTRQRLFTGSAREAAQLQYPRCTYPGCGVPTNSCQIDHITPARDDGPTAPWNSQPRCPRHNRWKELGYHTWQDTNGHWHTTRPDGTEIRSI